MSGITVRRARQERIITSTDTSMRLVRLNLNIRTREGSGVDQEDGAEAEAGAVEIITMMKRRESRSDENTRSKMGGLSPLADGARVSDAAYEMIDGLQIIMVKR
jgi:hypothetical protein